MSEDPFRIGARVRKRGFDHLGTVAKIGMIGLWIRWDEGRKRTERPALCSPRELEPVPDVF